MYKGDFLPLIDDVDPLNEKNHALDYWTGFYSNRPSFKQDVRNVMTQLRIQNKLLAYIYLQDLLVSK